MMSPTVFAAAAAAAVSFFFCSGHSVPLHAYSHGDIIIGGLFPLHRQTNPRTTQAPLSCSVFDVEAFLQAEVMIYAIREVNLGTPRLLPNFTLGYEIFDTCGDVSFAIRSTIHMLDSHKTNECLVPEKFQDPLPEPRTKAVIGERYSEVSIAAAQLLALSSVTQISYSSTSEQLSRKLKFPTFLRTISSDEHQTLAIAGLVRHFNWTTVGIIGSDDAYGKYGSDKIVSILSKKQDVCIEFIDILPDYFSHNTSQAHSRLDRLVKSISRSSAEAVIIFTKDKNADIIMKEAIKHNLKRTWIASDAWSISSSVSALPGIERAGKVFGIISKKNEVPGFKEHIMSKFSGTTDALLEYYLTIYPLCANETDKNKGGDCPLANSQPDSQRCLELSCLAKYIDEYITYNVFLAVQVIVKGLIRLLKCDNHRCKHSSNFTALEFYDSLSWDGENGSPATDTANLAALLLDYITPLLLTEIKKVNFTINNTHIYFDDNGDPRLGYDIVYWSTAGSTEGAQIKKVGEYWPGGEIKIPHDLVREKVTVMVTAYNCFKTCKPGHELKRQNKTCCNTCEQCADGDYSEGNGAECKPCGQQQYSSQQRDTCVNKTYEYLEWTDPFVIALNCIDVFGIIVTIVLAVLFTIHRSTPIVKAVGGYLCFLELFSLLVCFCLTFSFTGIPTDASCTVGMPVFGIAFSLCISCILANLLQILAGFSFDPVIGSWAKKLNQPLAVVALVFGVQLAVCVPWLLLFPPRLEMKDFETTILLQCDKGCNYFFVAMLLYISVLALSCFLFAYKGKQLPDLYRNAQLITTSMLLFLIIWIVFIPIYINLFGKYKEAIEVSAIIVSCYSILGCHLAPKCYIMVFRKEINNENAITEYIRRYYEQKNIPVM